jgi:hypothetical protein
MGMQRVTLIIVWNSPKLAGGPAIVYRFLMLRFTVLCSSGNPYA